MISLTFIGVIIGFVMGLTGAGGALVAIPLFMHFLQMSLKEASVYSLLAVVIASLTSFYSQRKKAIYHIALIFVISSGAGSFFSMPFKNILSDQIIALLLTLIALYSLFSIWKPQVFLSDTKTKESNFFLTIFLGILLGILTTFTGLGGGVLMLPVLLNIYRFKQEEAVSTSLLVIGISSLISFSIQFFESEGLSLDEDLWALILGILISSYGLKVLMKKISYDKIAFYRKIIFTLVVILSLVKVF